MIDREKIVRVFNDYVKNFDQEDGKVRLKIEHTLRVAELSDRIAKSLNFTKEDTDLAWLIGMLHDVGRFEQLKDYGTFNDAKSINHAHYGVKLLFEKGHIRDYMEDVYYDDLIETAIWYHNVFILPDNLDDKSKIFCNVIRDADKIDILKVNVEIPMETIYGISDKEIKQAVVTEEVMESFLEHHAVNHKLKKSPIDHIVGHASLAFELVFPISLEIVEEQGYLVKMLDYNLENKVTQNQFQVLNNDMQQYIRNHKRSCI
jgi:putative nucleotidyltransferase with HDIG domain